METDSNDVLFPQFVLHLSISQTTPIRKFKMLKVSKLHLEVRQKGSAELDGVVGQPHAQLT